MIVPNVQGQTTMVLRYILKNTCIVKGTNFSEMRVAKPASLALMLQERAEPSLLFLRARIAMILQILRTGRGQEIKGLKSLLHWRTNDSTREREKGCKRKCYLAPTFASAHRSWAPWVLCALCPKEHARSAAPGRRDQTPGNGQSSPQPAATDFTQTQKYLRRWGI